MIDTIILRLHDTRKYSHVIQGLDLFNNNGYSTQTGLVKASEIGKIQRGGHRTPSEVIEILQQRKTGEFIAKTKVGKQLNNSSHYSFAYFVDYTKDHIEFNFSIPKYKYGSNVIMFGEHWLDRDFQYHASSTLEGNLKKMPALFFQFIKRFFQVEFYYANVNLLDVEVHRIDVCFNQVFNSKEEALIYLEYQKKLNKKYTRNEDGVVRDYTTSLMFVTKRYSAKIYHKGSEYEKNDLKEHRKINEEKGKEYFDTKGFQDFSDRILRYELTIRNGLINYLHKRFLFRQNCTFYKIGLKDFVKVEAAEQKIERISKAVGKLPEREKLKYLIKHPYPELSSETRKVYRSVSKLINRRRYFMLAVDDESVLFNRRTVDYENDFALFSEKLLGLCLQKLVEFVKEFQVKKLPDIEIVKGLIDNYNAQSRLKLPKMEMLHFFVHLTSQGSFKEAGKFLFRSRATIFRFKQRFAKIGISDKSMKPVGDESMIPDALVDFTKYHSYLIHTKDLLRGIKTDL